MNIQIRSRKPTTVVWEVGVGNPFLSRTRPMWQSPGWRFTLFEANPSMYKELTVRLMNYTNVRALNIALHDQEGFRNLFLAGDRSFIEGTKSPIQCIYHNQFERLMGGFKVPVYCARMNQYDRGDIDILFLGVEGNEWAVLKYAISRPTFIIMPNYLANDYYYVPPDLVVMSEALKRRGYELLVSNPDDLVYFSRSESERSGITYSVDTAP